MLDPSSHTYSYFYFSVIFPACRPQTSITILISRTTESALVNLDSKEFLGYQSCLAILNPELLNLAKGLSPMNEQVNANTLNSSPTGLVEGVSKGGWWCKRMFTKINRHSPPHQELTFVEDLTPLTMPSYEPAVERQLALPIPR